MAVTRTQQRFWRPDEERELARLRALGLSRPEIARRLDRSPGSIRSQIRRCPEQYPKRLRQDAWYELLQVPHTIAEVAAAMGVKKCTVYLVRAWLRKKGYEVGPAKRKEEER